jgi:hypothetical protein
MPSEGENVAPMGLLLEEGFELISVALEERI